MTHKIPPDSSEPPSPEGDDPWSDEADAAITPIDALEDDLGEHEFDESDFDDDFDDDFEEEDDDGYEAAAANDGNDASDDAEDDVDAPVDETGDFDDDL